jgi:hypothetical protein
MGVLIENADYLLNLWPLTSYNNATQPASGLALGFAVVSHFVSMRLEAYLQAGGFFMPAPEGQLIAFGALSYQG